MSDVQMACPQAVRADQVSALYDDDLDIAAAARLREHIATCAVCQRRLDDYARISVALREQAVPQPDTRLRRSILAARSAGAAPTAHAGWAREAWRTAAVAAAVILIVGSIASLLLNHAMFTRIGASAATPTQADDAPTITPFPSATPMVPAPTGWREILPLQWFSLGGSQGFAVSAARPGRLVGCGVPGSARVSVDAWPYPALAISDDGGQTWRESDIQAIGSVYEWSSVKACVVVVDQLHPDTIIVGNADASRLAVTTDAGKTWRRLVLPQGMVMTFSQFPAFVNGQLIAIFRPTSGSGRWILGDLSVDGVFKVLDAALPYPDASMNSPMAFAVDPTDASRVYVIAAGKWDPAHPPQNTILFASYDAGASWRQIHVFGVAERISLWAPTPDALYVWVANPQKSLNGNPLQESLDGGVTWRSLTSTSFRLDSAWFGPSGQIVLISGEGGQAAPMVYELNPATGKLTPMGPLPPASTSGFGAVVTGGAHPVFVVASFYGTYARPLP